MIETLMAVDWVWNTETNILWEKEIEVDEVDEVDEY